MKKGRDLSDEEFRRLIIDAVVGDKGHGQFMIIPILEALKEAMISSAEELTEAGEYVYGDIPNMIQEIVETIQSREDEIDGETGGDEDSSNGSR